MQDRETGFTPFYRSLVIDANCDALVSYLTSKFGFDLDIAQAMINQLPELLAADFRVLAPEEEHHLAERAVDGFFGYLLLARNGSGFVPSKYIDWVFEACMVRSHTFWALCDVIVGFYVHHFPWDLEGFGPVDRDEARMLGLMATRAALGQIGPVDDLVWVALALNGCNLCISDGKVGMHVSAEAEEVGHPPGPDGPRQPDYLCYATAGTERSAGALGIRVGSDQQVRHLTTV
jgi:hypothetical protein